MNIDDLLKYLFPKGTVLNVNKNRNKDVKPNFIFCPVWPTDVFAFVATVIDKTNLLHLPLSIRNLEEFSNIQSVATQWRSRFSAPKEVQACWDEIYKNRGLSIRGIKDDANIQKCLHLLLRYADAAANGIGWGSDDIDSVFNALFTLGIEGNADVVLKPFIPPYPSESLCHMIPTERAVVSAKSLLAEVGYTIRSLSHHLALLEPQPKLKINWCMAEFSYDFAVSEHDEHYNILFIPFPFKIPAGCVKPSAPVKKIDSTKSSKSYGYFQLNQDWLPNDNGVMKSPVDSAKVIYDDLIKPLLDDARAHSKYIDCIVLPECALTKCIAEELAQLLRDSEYVNGLRLFVTGAIDGAEASSLPKNKALAYFFVKSGKIEGGHTKHHRWKLDVSQIRRYGFSAFSSDPNTDWWERIDVSERELPFYAIRKHACMTVLVCEDLARNDPALPAVRAIGPNLVIALLMDGPQIAARWPARYATVLADDPGSAVLSVTSAAMVDRSNRQELSSQRSVALWKHHSGRTESIILPPNHHGFLLSLGSCYVEQMTMDNTLDGGISRRFELMGVEPLKLAKVEPWL